MVECDRSHRVEVVQVVLVRVVVSVPGDYVEGRVVLIVFEKLTIELGNNFPLLLIGRDAVILLVSC